MSTDLFALEPLLIARLQAQVTYAGAHIGSASALAGRSDIASYMPGVFVQAGAAQATDQGDDGALAIEQQQWDVVVGVALDRDTAQLSARYTALSTLANQVRAALAGWQPAGFATVQYTGRAAPEVIDGGWAELAMHFQTTAAQGA